jgi:UDP-N-acetyl-D-mannosaminuronate dehydrogenase
MSIKVCVIGLGKLGSPLAAYLAGKGLPVVGVDNDPHKIDAINQSSLLRLA